MQYPNREALRFTAINRIVVMTAIWPTLMFAVSAKDHWLLGWVVVAIAEIARRRVIPITANLIRFEAKLYHWLKG